MRFDASDEEIIHAAIERRMEWPSRVIYVALIGGISDHAPVVAKVDFSDIGRPAVTRESYAQRYPNLCT